MPLTVCTWNINSVRLREGLVLKLMEEEAPDVLCLQETKTRDETFPHENFAARGYAHRLIRGDKGYNGVAILSKRPLAPEPEAALCREGHARHVAGRLPDGTVIHNLYIPAGGDEPDPEANPKFAHKLDFVDRLRAWGRARSGPAILVGDLNIAPRPDDVWSHKQLLKVVSHTPVETEALDAALVEGGWTDAVRASIPDGPLFSWWSYRAKDWAASDRGRRLDHVWASAEVAPKASGARVLKAARGWEKPSDHAPVFATFDL
jgi:exodeoxyribonuclease III (xth)